MLMWMVSRWIRRIWKWNRFWMVWNMFWKCRIRDNIIRREIR